MEMSREIFSYKNDNLCFSFNEVLAVNEMNYTLCLFCGAYKLTAYLFEPSTTQIAHRVGRKYKIMAILCILKLWFTSVHQRLAQSRKRRKKALFQDFLRDATGDQSQFTNLKRLCTSFTWNKEKSAVLITVNEHNLDKAVCLRQCFSTFFASRTTLCNKKILGNTKQNFIITIMMFSSVLALLIY